MISIEKERISLAEFKAKYDNLDHDQALYVKKILESLLGEQHLYMIREFLGDNKRIEE